MGCRNIVQFDQINKCLYKAWHRRLDCKECQNLASMHTLECSCRSRRPLRCCHRRTLRRRSCSRRRKLEVFRMCRNHKNRLLVSDTYIDQNCKVRHQTDSRQSSYITAITRPGRRCYDSLQLRDPQNCTSLLLNMVPNCQTLLEWSKLAQSHIQHRFDRYCRIPHSARVRAC